MSKYLLNPLSLYKPGGLSRRSFMGRTAAVAATVASGSLLAGRASAAKHGGRLRVGLAGSNTSDNWDGRTHADTFTTMMGVGGVFDALTEVAANGELVGELAESWEATADAKTWTFKLRKGVVFHNGKSFGADDVIESLSLHTMEGSKSAAKPIISAITDMKKINDLEVQFELKAGNADFPFLLSDYHLLIYPAGQIEEAIATGIGTGLYTPASFDPGVRLVLNRFADHYKGDSAGFFDEVEMIGINDVSARQNALITGQIDVMNRIDFKTEALIRMNPAFEIFEVTGNQHYTFPMLTNVTPFDDMNVRKALKHAINRQEMVDKVLQGHGAVGNDHQIGPANQYYAADLPQNEYDPDKAKFYLKESGLDSIDLDLSTSNAAFSGAVDAAQLYQASAKKAGININVIQEPADGYWSNVWLKKPWSAAYWSGRATEDWMFSTAAEIGAPWNDTLWENDRFQELLPMARAELDTDKRRKMYREMQSLMSTEGGVIVPMYANFVDGASKKLAHGPDIGNKAQMDSNRLIERWWFA